MCSKRAETADWKRLSLHERLPPPNRPLSMQRLEVRVSSDSLDQLRDSLRVFARERDWDQFHSPKNLCCALVVESGELLEHFQWAPDSDSHALTSERRDRVGEELADVLIYLVRLADKLEIDVISATETKLAKNALKYPVAIAKGKSDKYSDF